MDTPSETHQLPATGHRAPASAARAGRMHWRGIAIIAVAAFAVEMAVSARYGYVRDELYFLSAGHHLAFGFVDQPPLTPLLARLGEIVGQGTLAGLRVLPALALAALVVATATMSRMLGAGRTGQLLAALAAATCGEYLGAMHELTTTPPDYDFFTDLERSLKERGRELDNSPVFRKRWSLLRPMTPLEINIDVCPAGLA